MIPMAWALCDRGTPTQLEKRNQSYLRRLSDRDNNRVIEREKNVYFSLDCNNGAPADGLLLQLNVTSPVSRFVLPPTADGISDM